MLIDDDQDDQESFISALEEVNGVTLFGIANDGKEALTKLNKSSILPAMIFMDINMPIMNGIDCLGRIMADPTMREIQVVMLSTDVYHHDKTKALGAAGFIKKQTSIPALRNELERVIKTLTIKIPIANGQCVTQYQYDNKK
jgi:CheY-like chemotaxis protein